MEAWKEELHRDEIYHHGILGQKWGIRRYQNEDGTLTEAGRMRLEKKDLKWAKKKQDKITNKAYKLSKKELAKYSKKILDEKHTSRNKDGSLNMQYALRYNQKMAELMNEKVKDLRSPSGKVVSFVAKRGELGVHMALADSGYDFSTVKNGIYSSGKVAYKKDIIERV